MSVVVGDWVSVYEGVEVGVTEGEAVCVIVSVVDMDGDIVGDKETVGVVVGVTVGVGVGEADSEKVGLQLLVLVCVSVSEFETLSDGDNVKVEVGVPEGVNDGVVVLVIEPVRVQVTVLKGVKEIEGEKVSEGV